MSFVLDQPDSKRVKHVDLNGREETEDQGKAALQAALTAALQVQRCCHSCRCVHRVAIYLI